jgi:hypothetical protein
MVRPIILLPFVWLALSCAGTVAQSQTNALMARDGLGADPNARPSHQMPGETSLSLQNDPDVTGALPSQRPVWFPVLSPEEVEQEKRLQEAITICRGC